jgi:hypothetical protein
MQNDTRSGVTLAVTTDTQRSILLEISDGLWSYWREQAEESSGSDLAEMRQDIADSEIVCERLEAGGSCCLIPGAMLDALYQYLGDYLSAAAGELDEDHRDALPGAVEVLPLMVALASGMSDRSQIRQAA